MESPWESNAGDQEFRLIMFSFLSRVALVVYHPGIQIGQSVDQQPYGITSRLSHSPRLHCLADREARLLHGHTLILKIPSNCL